MIISINLSMILLFIIEPLSFTNLSKKGLHNFFGSKHGFKNDFNFGFGKRGEGSITNVGMWICGYVCVGCCH